VTIPQPGRFLTGQALFVFGSNFAVRGIVPQYPEDIVHRPERQGVATFSWQRTRDRRRSIFSDPSCRLTPHGGT